MCREDDHRGIASNCDLRNEILKMNVKDSEEGRRKLISNTRGHIRARAESGTEVFQNVSIDEILS